VIAELRERYQTPYPLALITPYVHDRDLVMSLPERNDLPVALAVIVRTGQGIMISKTADRFFRKVEFGEHESGHALRLWPAGKESPVAIDPLKRFGRPNVDGISTERLWELYDAGESVEQIPEVYAMEVARVRAGVLYEEQHRSLAA
jgi:uncharacterized protein (DUF433 family)